MKRILKKWGVSVWTDPTRSENRQTVGYAETIISHRVPYKAEQAERLSASQKGLYSVELVSD
jgi:hypothetical protein